MQQNYLTRTHTPSDMPDCANCTYDSSCPRCCCHSHPSRQTAATIKQLLQERTEPPMALCCNQVMNRGSLNLQLGLFGAHIWSRLVKIVVVQQPFNVCAFLDPQVYMPLTVCAHVYTYTGFLSPLSTLWLACIACMRQELCSDPRFVASVSCCFCTASVDSKCIARCTPESGST